MPHIHRQHKVNNHMHKHAHNNINGELYYIYSLQAVVGITETYKINVNSWNVVYIK